MSDHISLAREYIAKGEEFYAKAADEMVAAFNAGMSHKAIAAALGRSHDWVRTLIRWREANGPAGPNASDPLPTPFAGQYEERMDRAARTAMKDPEQRRQTIAALSSDQIEDVIATAQDVAVERTRAQRSERDITPKAPTAGALMGGDSWDPSESWADTLVIRVNRNARELDGLIKRAGGLLFGSMPAGEAFEYLAEAERLIAEARAAAHEQMRDQAQVH